jgi:serine/threonine protein kinase
MPLSAGTKLGPYEIVAPLGAGGMGEVYRARDTRLSRDVAVKVLPEHLSAHPEIRARFEREAKTVSSLNHAHICTLYDVGREAAIWLGRLTTAVLPIQAAHSSERQRFPHQRPTTLHSHEHHVH